jgi:hypothetical protein
MVITLLPPSAFDSMVMVLVNAPTRPCVLYVAVITDSLPGKMGSLGQVGTVHPQLALTLERINGSFPSFLNLNSWVACGPSTTVPKSKDSCTNLILGAFGFGFTSAGLSCAKAVTPIVTQ